MPLLFGISDTERKKSPTPVWVENGHVWESPDKILEGTHTHNRQVVLPPWRELSGYSGWLILLRLDVKNGKGAVHGNLYKVKEANLILDEEGGLPTITGVVQDQYGKTTPNMAPPWLEGPVLILGQTPPLLMERLVWQPYPGRKGCGYWGVMAHEETIGKFYPLQKNAWPRPIDGLLHLLKTNLAGVDTSPWYHVTRRALPMELKSQYHPLAWETVVALLTEPVASYWLNHVRIWDDPPRRPFTVCLHAWRAAGFPIWNFQGSNVAAEKWGTS